MTTDLPPAVARRCSWSDREFIGVRVRRDVTGEEQDGDEFTVAADVGGDDFNGPGHFTFALVGDKVARMTSRA